MNDDIFDKPSEAEIDKIHEVDLKEKMETFYIDYAMSVIASRALPDVRDGLKPVQRRVLYSMIELNNGPDKPHRKSARIVGDTMGKYHPHGDSSIYGALVNMAQDWSTRYPLVDGHGNFGSMDGDGAAAMRYTEARLSKISMELLADIEAGVRFDVLFLDVLMPGINTVREIRRYDTAVQIIFVTSSSEFAVQSYVVGAYYYQLKPIWKDSFFRLTDAVLAECRKRTQHLPPRSAPPHAVSGGLHREWPHRAGAGLHPQRLQRDRGRQGDRLLRERGGKPDLFRLCGPRR